MLRIWYDKFKRPKNDEEGVNILGGISGEGNRG